MKEYKVFGPPGTGKTSALATRFVPGSIKKFGRERVMITSFTRAAAREIAMKPSRATGERILLPTSQVGTLHQICYHALGKPTIAEVSKELIAQWNTAEPYHLISGKSSRNFEDLHPEPSSGKAQTDDFRGDRFLTTLSHNRNRMLAEDRRMISHEQRKFDERWAKFKADTMSVDFTDLIEIALRDIPYAPGQPEVLYVDEAQDFTPLQLALCRSWGNQMQHIVLVGDDDQCIYQFTGASPEAFLQSTGKDDDRKEILSQSWRVPYNVLKFAEKIIMRVPKRQEKPYMPRFDPKTKEPVMGHVISKQNASFKTPEPLLETIAENIESKKSVMILGTCSYMLEPLKILLKEHSIPFGNHYRKARADWNPLNYKSARIVSAFMGTGIDGDYWSVPQFILWAEQILVDNKNGLLWRRGAKALAYLKDLVKDDSAEGLHTVRHIISQIMGPNAINQALRRNTEWFLEHLKSGHKETIKYPFKVYEKYGPDFFETTPPVTIGTIHSVKGGEADTVCLFPDLSLPAREAYASAKPDAYCPILRTFYVGATRARENLVICGPAYKTTHTQQQLYVKFKF